MEERESDHQNLGGRVKGRARERGMATVVALALMAMLLVVVAANVRTLRQVKQELKLIERKQLRHLQAQNTAADSTAPAKP